MSRSALAGAALAGAALAATPALAIDQFFPTFGNTGYDVASYDLALDVDPETNTLQGVAKIALTAERSLSLFTLDLSGLTVQSVRVDGLRAKFTRQSDKLIVSTPYIVRKGQASTVTVVYGGTPTTLPNAADLGLPSYIYNGWVHKDAYSYVTSEPVGASTFFPVNDEPTDRATFRFKISVKKPYTAVANGSLANVAETGDRRTYTWVMNQPMTSWLATVHVNQFTQSTAYTKRGIPVRVFTTASATDENVAGFLKAATMIDWLESLVGPYPFASYGSASVDDPTLYYALETQAMSTFQTLNSGESVVVHELAHQWFGNSVSQAEWRDLWLAEGFATYFETLWPFRTTPDAFDAAFRQAYDMADTYKIGPAVLDGPTDVVSPRPYVRGALALYALRQKVGDAMFLKIAKTWSAWFRGQPVTTADFLNTAVLVSGDPSVRDVVTPWLYDETLPPFPGPATGATTASSARVKATVANLVGVRCTLGSIGPRADCAR